MAKYLNSEKAKLIEFLTRIPYLGSQSIIRLTTQYSSLEAIQKAVKGSSPKNLSFISEMGRRSLKETLQQSPHYSDNPYYFCYQDAIYPKKLLQLFDPPCGMYFKGNETLLNYPGPWIGIVGTRSASQYALKVTQQILIGLKPNQPMVVSGMAVGVDGKGHETAIECDLPTIGVLGTSIDQVYPPFYKTLHQQMEKHGLLLAELPPGSPIGPWNFPKRNRIIAALSDILIIVEAPEKSGALLTAQFALELGKEIFVVPGPFNSFKNRGGHRMIQEGAHLLRDVDEIVQYFKNLNHPVSLFDGKGNSFENPKSKNNAVLTAEEQTIVDLLKEEGMHVDKMVAVSHLPAPQVTGVLMNLTLRGIIQELPGKIFEMNEMM